MSPSDEWAACARWLARPRNAVPVALWLCMWVAGLLFDPAWWFLALVAVFFLAPILIAVNSNG